MYKSPIEIINDFNNGVAKAVMDETEKQVYKAVYNVGVNVDKDELIKALEYDRNQYEKGYRDGKESAVVHAHWIEEEDCTAYTDIPWSMCSACGSYSLKLPYCAFCGAKMDEEGGANNA